MSNDLSVESRIEKLESERVEFFNLVGRLLSESVRTNRILAGRGGAVANELRRTGRSNEAEAFERFAERALAHAFWAERTRHDLPDRPDGEQ